MSYHGDIRLEKTIDLKFATRRFSTGAPFTLAGSPTVAAYPDNSTTEITAGITLTVDFDARTGLNNVRVAATAANGYASGVNYSLVITAGTVDGVSVVGEVIGSFSIEARSALMPTTADRTLNCINGRGDADVEMVNGVAVPSTAGRPEVIVNSIATDAVDANAVKADAVAELQSGLATAATLATVKTKTDSLTFSVAGVVDANIQRVNDIDIVGNGQSGNEWGPA